MQKLMKGTTRERICQILPQMHLKIDEGKVYIQF